MISFRDECSEQTTVIGKAALTRLHVHEHVVIAVYVRVLHDLLIDLRIGKRLARLPRLVESGAGLDILEL